MIATYKEFSESLSDEQREFLKCKLEFMFNIIRSRIKLVKLMKKERDYAFLKEEVLEPIQIASVYYELLDKNELRHQYLDCIKKLIEL